jgi:cell wall-associated NlpC family hydrolase
MKHVETARSLLNVPWVHQGRDPAIGIDCAGLVLLAFEMHDPTTYGRHPHAGLFEQRCEHHLGPPVDDEPRVGDVVLLGFGRRGPSRHIGIIGDYIYGGLSIIHTDSVVGRVVEHPFDDKWRRRVRKVYRRGGDA